MLRKIKLALIWPVIFGTFIIVVIIAYFLLNYKSVQIQRNKILTNSVIDYPPEYNYRQTINDCGPFNVAAVVRALKKEQVNSHEFAKNIGWRLPNKYTLPLGMEKQLQENGISVEVPYLKALTDDDKINFLRERLSLGRPIIILGQINNFEHYLTIFGFSGRDNEFFVYDSILNKGKDGLTKDQNGSMPGNRNLTAEELLNFWRKGGMYGLYKWYAIVASVN